VKKTHRCLIDIEGFRKTKSGKKKIWRTDNVPTYCCCTLPALFIWEKGTSHNGYEPYSGYVNEKSVTILD